MSQSLETGRQGGEGPQGKNYKRELLKLGAISVVVTGGVGLLIASLDVQKHKQLAVSQAPTEQAGEQEVLSGSQFEGNKVTDRELRLRVPGTNKFQRFEMPKDIAPEPPTK
jgi:hypothetical protein